MKQLLAVLMFLPVFAFLIAGLMEMRSDRTFTQRLGKVIPVILGLGAFVLSLDPQVFLHVTPASSVTLSRVMTLFSALIACSGAFVNYSRRASSVFMAIGGMLMAFLWIFFGQLRV